MHCKNSNTKLIEGNDFCGFCGAKVIRNRLTIKNLFIHITEQFFNYDNKFLNTFIGIIKNPKDVIDGYINGTRKKYINPISFFAISLTFSGFSIFLIKKFFIDTIFSENVFGFDNPMSQQIMEQTPKFTLEYNSLILSFLIPLLALISLIVFYNKKYNYTEHLVIYLYSISLITIISVVFGLIVLLIEPSAYMYFGLSLNLLNIIFHCYLLKRIFNLSGSELLLKFLIFLFVAGIFYIGFSIFVFVILLLTGVINPQDFAPPS
ncbi:MAG: DUF3667 domain-containing protein [Bacteroidia bacterium]|nr:DUF3667 domain-containing protein [Bacteroidia bacterium]